MDALKEETKKCENCDREIASSTFLSHELHCKRYLVKCPKCGEAVPKVSLEEHDEAEHKLIECKHCKVELYEIDMDDHQMNYCSERPMICPYCELEFSHSQLRDHEDVCGSRTDVCEKCQSTVMLKNMLKHESSQCKDFATDQHQSSQHAIRHANMPTDMPANMAFYPFPFMPPQHGAMNRLPKINNSQANQASSNEHSLSQFSNNGVNYAKPTSGASERRSTRPINESGRPLSKPHSSRNIESFQAMPHANYSKMDARPKHANISKPQISDSGDPAAGKYSKDKKHRIAQPNASKARAPPNIKPSSLKAVTDLAKNEQNMEDAADKRSSDEYYHQNKTTKFEETIADKDCAPCEVCNKQLPINLLLRHQEECAKGMFFDDYAEPLVDKVPQDRGPEQRFETRDPSPKNFNEYQEGNEDDGKEPCHCYRHSDVKPLASSLEPSSSTLPSPAMAHYPKGSQMYMYAYTPEAEGQSYEGSQDAQQYGDSPRPGYGPRYLLFIPPAPAPDEEDDEYASCEHCEFPIPLRDLTRHELVCKKAPRVAMPDRNRGGPVEPAPSPLSPTTRDRFESIGYDDWGESQVSRQYPTSSPMYYNYGRNYPRNTDYYSQGLTDEEMIPCAYCNQQFPQKILAQHDLTCKGNKDWSRKPEIYEDDSPESSTGSFAGSGKSNSSGRDRGIENAHSLGKRDYKK
ncbi:TRAF-type zinc finger domain-containing protein 1-like [Watersipora subatra]|uniref:TRAF-type zinc finger domain-containing protein 1-like n=1 Tax=Watersipora subatra TaxID=2589382 RepID=UPI00355B782E